MGQIGLRSAKASDGSGRPFATVYEDSAYLALGRLDLTGVERITFDLQSTPALHPYSIELRTDAITGPLIGHVDVTPTSGEGWYQRPIPVTTTGEAPLFVVFRSSAKEVGQFNALVSVDGIHFERSAAADADARRPQR